VPALSTDYTDFTDLETAEAIQPAPGSLPGELRVT